MGPTYLSLPRAIASSVRALLVVLPATLTLLLAGCGHQQTERSLLVALNAGTEGDAVQLAAREWGAEQGVNVETVVLPYNSLFEKELLDLTSGSGSYDVMLIDDSWFPAMVEDGNLVALDEHLAKRGVEADDTDFVKSALDLCRHPYRTGPYYALPFVGNTQIFFYRADVFEKHGLEHPPRTWADVLHAAKTIGSGEEGMYGYAQRAAAGNAVVSAFMPLLWAFGGEVFDERGQPSVSSPEAAEALEFMLELGKYSPPGYAGMNADEVAAHMLQSTAPMSVNWPSWISAMDHPNKSRVAGKIDFAQMPSGKYPGTPMIGVWVLGISSRSKNVELAVDFLVWITHQKRMKQAAQRGSPPTRRSVFQDPELQAQYRSYPVQLDSLETARARHRTPYWLEIENVYGIFLSQANAGSMAPEEALERSNQAIAGILRR